MPLRQITRWVAAALFAAGAAPAFAQTASISVALELDGDFDNSTTPPLPTPATAGFTIGTEETYSLTVENTGELIVTEFIVNAAIDAPALTTISSITDCKPTGTGTSPPMFPCKWTGTLAAGDSTTLTIAATYPAPKPLNPGTATCPAGTVSVNASATVGSVKQGDLDLGIADQTVPYTTKLRDWADLEVTSFDGPGNVSQGQTVTYTTVVKNLGPCPAPNVRVTFAPDGGSLVYVDGSATGCTNPATSVKGPPQGFGYAYNCDVVAVGTALAKGATKTVTADFSVITFPKEQIKGAVSNGAAVVSRSVKTASGPPEVWSVGADDPNADNDSNGTTGTVDLSSNGGGCSTGGGSSLLVAALALVAFRLARRRTA